ncbi:MAG TPA: hydrogenase maturation protease [Terriglobales bacterium]|nr:hydrogenase maturation protease [Terriglobales bacterium]
MGDLRQQLGQSLSGRVCFMGLGNIDYGDDGFGVRLAEELTAAGVADVIVAATTPDRWISHFTGFDHIVFLDAVEFGGAPGGVAFLDSAQVAARFPQISTHKISVQVLARWVELTGTTKAWLLGAQPVSLKPSSQLTPTLQVTLRSLRQLLCSLKLASVPAGVGAEGKVHA